MSNMSAFEIRLELLKMARDLLVQDYQARKHALEAQWSTQVEASKIAGTTSPDYPQLPQFPNEEDITKKAEALNNFVSQTPVVKVATKK